MSKRTEDETKKIRERFNWIVKSTHIDLDDTNLICLAPDKRMAEKIALNLSQNNKDYYYEVEEL